MVWMQTCVESLMKDMRAGTNRVRKVFLLIDFTSVPFLFQSTILSHRMLQEYLRRGQIAGR
jgi:hypothetical protein